MVCSRLQQAALAFRLYPSAHPTAHKVLVDLVEELGRHLARHGSLELRVEESTLLLHDEEVWHQGDLRTSMAFVMFRDGLRFVTFHPGIDESELASFVDCLAHADELASIEYDLATALWERDLQHVDYEVADPFLGGAGQSLRDEAVNDLRNTVLTRLGELNPGSGVDGPTGGGDDGGGHDGAGGGSTASAPRAVEPDIVTVTEPDIQRGEQAVADLDDAFDDFALVLLEIAGIPEPPHGRDLLTRSLGMVAERYLELGDTAGLGAMVDRLTHLEQRKRRPPEFADSVFGEAATSERLTGYINRLDQASPAELREGEDVLARMRDWILPTLIGMLTESNDKGLRKVALDVIDKAGGVPTEHLWQLLRDPRWYVVRNAVSLAAGSEHPQLLERLEPLLRHPDARVRREVMRAADTVSGSRPASLFARALSDDDLSVRVLAANGLGRHGIRGNSQVLDTLIDSRDFATRPAEEINAVLSAYAGLCGEASVEVLDRMWRRRVLGSKPLPLRLGAVQALGMVATPSALDALRAASNCGDSQIQKAAARALAEARARMWGERP
jgi:hypothetical protein